MVGSDAVAVADGCWTGVAEELVYAFRLLLSGVLLINFDEFWLVPWGGSNIVKGLIQGIAPLIRINSQTFIYIDSFLIQLVPAAFAETRRLPPLLAFLLRLLMLTPEEHCTVCVFISSGWDEGTDIGIRSEIRTGVWGFNWLFEGVGVGGSTGLTWVFGSGRGLRVEVYAELLRHLGVRSVTSGLLTLLVLTHLV